MFLKQARQGEDGLGKEVAWCWVPTEQDSLHPERICGAFPKTKYYLSIYEGGRVSLLANLDCPACPQPHKQS